MASKRTASFSGRISGRFQRKLGSLKRTARVAQQGLDQVLISLQHKGLSLGGTSEDIFQDIQDIRQKVGHAVLNRAEAIRSQLANNSLSPAWLKEVSLAPTATTASPRSSESSTSPSKSTAEVEPAVAASPVSSETTETEAPKKTAHVKRPKSSPTVKEKSASRGVKDLATRSTRTSEK